MVEYTTYGTKDPSDDMMGFQHCSSSTTNTVVSTTGSTEGEVYYMSIDSNESADENTPLASTKKITIMNKRNTSAADLRLSMLSNFSTAYNIVNVSLALKIMGTIYEASDDLKSLCTSTLIGGMIVGQLTGGALGDWMGRHAAMAFVMCLQVVSAFMSALSFGWEADANTMERGSGWHASGFIEAKLLALVGIKGLSVYHFLAGWRFLLGVGCGGVYPLAATLTAESSTEKANRGRLVALTFSMQGVGYLASPLAGWALVTVLGETSDLAWRILLGLGCVPGLILIAVRVGRRKIRSRDPVNKTSINDSLDVEEVTPEQPAASSTKRLSAVSILDAIRTEEQLGRKLLGAGGSWLLFDVLFYGNTLFQPVVLSAAFGSAETVRVTARDTALIAAVALPGYFISVYAVGRQSPRYIQMQGFFVMSILYGIIGFTFDSLSEKRSLLLALYASTFFFSNYGPNSTTFMLPSMTFSRACRSTLNGICAACGKIGALLGTVLFVPVAGRYGNDIVMLMCAVISILNLILTWVCVSENVGREESNGLDAADEVEGEVSTFDNKKIAYNSELDLLAAVEAEEGQIESDVEEQRARKKTIPRNISAPSFLDFQD